MTRMTFWLCKGREIIEINNHRSRRMSCHRRQNNPFPVSSKGPLECHEAGGAPQGTWDLLIHLLASFGVIFYVRINPCPVHMLFGIFLYLICWEMAYRVDGLDTPLEVLPVWLTSVLSGAVHHLFKIIKKFINYIGHEKRRTTWSHVEMLLRWITISNNLSNVNGRLKMT